MSREASSSLQLTPQQVDTERRLLENSIALLEDVLKEQAKLTGASDGAALDAIKSKVQKSLAQIRRAGVVFGMDSKHPDVTSWIAGETEAVVEQPEEKNPQEAIVKLASPSVCTSLSKHKDWDMDIFQLERESNGRPLSVFAFHAFEQLNFFDGEFKIPRDKFARFILAVESDYLDVPYHNKLHGADVMQSTYHFFSLTSVRSKLNPFTVMSGLVAAAVHDVKHPGLNNSYLAAEKTDLATVYNDKSILENMHVSHAFFLMKRPGLDFTSHLTAVQKQKFRKLMIDAVLGTDMALHNAEFARLDNRLKRTDAKASDWSGDEDQALIAALTLHTSDLANPAKPAAISSKWTDLVTQEFHAQGRRELAQGKKITMAVFDPSAPIYKGQIGFINFAVKPLFELYAKLAPEVTSTAIACVTENLNKWVEIQTKTEGPATKPEGSAPSGSAPVANAVGGGGQGRQ